MKRTRTALAAISLAAFLLPGPGAAPQAQEAVGPVTYSDGEHTAASELGLSTTGQVRVNQSANVTFLTDEDSSIELNDGFVAEPGPTGLFVAETRGLVDVLAAIGGPSLIDLSGASTTTSDSPTANARFGNGLALDRIHDRMIVRDRDRAYIFSLSGGVWLQESTLDAAALALPVDDVSSTVSIYGEWAVVGNPHANEGVGAVVVFKKQGAIWSEHETIASPWQSLAGRFGHSVSLVNRQLIVGAYLLNDTTDANKGTGRAVVYSLENDTWTGSSQILFYDNVASGGSVQSYKLGYAVDIYEESAVVAESDRFGASDPNVPQVQAYSNNGVTWLSPDTFTDPQDPITENTRFGWSVSVSGDVLAIGAPYKDEEGFSDSGAVYLYRKVGSAWEFAQRLIAWDIATSSHFGHSVDVFGDTLVVGKMAGASRFYIYRYNAALSSWRLVNTLEVDALDAGSDYRVAVGESYVVAARPESVVSVAGSPLASAGSLSSFALTNASAPPADMPAYNHLPVANVDSILLSDGNSSGSVNALSNDNDGEGGPASIYQTGLASGDNRYGSLSIASNGVATYTVDNGKVKPLHPGDGASVGESFTYEITDGLDRAKGAINVTIAGIVNHPPELLGSPIGAITGPLQGQPITPIGIPTFSDPEGRALNFSVAPATWLEVSPAGDTLVGTPNLTGTQEFDLYAHDDATQSLPLRFSVVVASQTPPSAPSLSATPVDSDTIRVSWTASSQGSGGPIATYQLRNLTDNLPVATVAASSPRSLDVNGLLPGKSYQFSVVAIDGAVIASSPGVSSISYTSMANIPVDASTFTLQPIGSGVSSAAASYVTDQGGYLIMTARSGDIATSPDSFLFARARLTGNLVIQAETPVFDAIDPAAKTGLMIRLDDSPGSPFAALALEGTGSIKLLSRMVQDGPVTAESYVYTGPNILSLERNGATVSAKVNGSLTKTITNFPLGAALAGSYVASADIDAPATSSFVDVSLQGGIESAITGIPIAALLEKDLDLDGDGMPDGWERLHGFDPLDASDGAAISDRDGDGVSNAQEYINRSDPNAYDNGGDGFGIASETFTQPGSNEILIVYPDGVFHTIQLPEYLLDAGPTPQ